MDPNREININIATLFSFIMESYMPHMSSSEFKIFLLIYHLTLGMCKQENAISLSTMVKATGMTRNTVLKGINSLEESNYILKFTEQLPFKYSLNYSTIMNGDGSFHEPNYYIINSAGAPTRTIEPISN